MIIIDMKKILLILVACIALFACENERPQFENEPNVSDAVSYTHLDVYKRQMYGGWRGIPTYYLCQAPFQGYAHQDRCLDVYKRQL